MDWAGFLTQFFPAATATFLGVLGGLVSGAAYNRWRDGRARQRSEQSSEEDRRRLLALLREDVAEQQESVRVLQAEIQKAAPVIDFSMNLDWWHSVNNEIMRGLRLDQSKRKVNDLFHLLGDISLSLRLYSEMSGRTDRLAMTRLQTLSRNLTERIARAESLGFEVLDLLKQEEGL